MMGWDRDQVCVWDLAVKRSLEIWKGALVPVGLHRKAERNPKCQLSGIHIAVFFTMASILELLLPEWHSADFCSSGEYTLCWAAKLDRF